MEYSHKVKKLVPKRIGQGSLSHSSISMPVKYNSKHNGHNKVAFNIPIKEKNNEIWPTETFPKVFLNKT